MPEYKIWTCCQCRYHVNTLSAHMLYCRREDTLVMKTHALVPVDSFGSPIDETPKPLMQHIEEVILQSLRNRHAADIEDAYAVLLVDWNLSDFLNSQYENEHSRKVTQVVALPSRGTLVPEAVQQALVDSKVTLYSQTLRINITIELTPGEMQNAIISLKSKWSGIVEVVQIVAWIGAARQTSHDQGIQYINTDFSIRSDQARPKKPVFRLKYKVAPLPDNEQYCWHSLFTNAVIIQRYPIPDRDPHVQGLEIPIELMAALGGARHAMDFDGGLVLKGFSALFIPVERYGNCVQWHLIHYREGNHISYQELRRRSCTRLMLDTGGDLDQPGGLNHASLWQTRAFLGWWKMIETHLDTLNADYKAIAWSTAMDVERCTRLSGGTLGFSSTGLGTLNFNLGIKDGRLHFGLQGTYHSIIQRAEKTPVLPFEPSQGERRGWLAPALDVIVHIAQTKHRQTPYAVDKQKVALVPRDPIECRNGAKNMLTANESLRLCDRSYSASGQDFTFEDLIFELFSLNDRLIEKDLHSENISGKSNQVKWQKTLKGWEFMAPVEDISPLHLAYS